MYMHILAQDYTWACPSNLLTGLRNSRAGTYRSRVSWALLQCDEPGGAVNFEKMMGRVGPRLLEK